MDEYQSIRYEKLLFFLFSLFIFFFYFFIPPVFAAAPQITASPSGSIGLDQSFTVSATMSGLSHHAVYRLRIVLAQPGTSNYFGSTYDGTSWHSGSINAGNFLPITTDAVGSWFGDIQGKIDPEDPSFTTGSGTYDLKVGRYTQTGSTATWSDPVGVAVAVPPTPTPTNTPIPTLGATITPTPVKLPTATPIPTIKPSVTRSIPSPTRKSVLAASDSAIDEATTEAAVRTEPAVTKEAKSSAGQTQVQGMSAVSVGLTGAGILGIACGILLFLRIRRQSTKEL